MWRACGQSFVVFPCFLIGNRRWARPGAASGRATSNRTLANPGVDQELDWIPVGAVSNVGKQHQLVTHIDGGDCTTKCCMQLFLLHFLQGDRVCVEKCDTIQTCCSQLLAGFANQTVAVSPCRAHSFLKRISQRPGTPSLVSSSLTNVRYTFCWSACLVQNGFRYIHIYGIFVSYVGAAGCSPFPWPRVLRQNHRVGVRPPNSAWNWHALELKRGWGTWGGSH